MIHVPYHRGDFWIFMGVSKPCDCFEASRHPPKTHGFSRVIRYTVIVTKLRRTLKEASGFYGWLEASLHPQKTHGF